MTRSEKQQSALKKKIKRLGWRFDIVALATLTKKSHGGHDIIDVAYHKLNWHHSTKGAV